MDGGADGAATRIKLVGFGDNVVDRYLDRGLFYPGGNALNVAVYAGTGNAANGQGAHRMHQVGAGADGYQPGERTVMHEAGVVLAEHQCDQRTADHRHQRVERDESGDLVERLRAHDVEAEPADGEDPGTEREEGDR